MGYLVNVCTKRFDDTLDEASRSSVYSYKVPQIQQQFLNMLPQLEGALSAMKLLSMPSLHASQMRQPRIIQPSRLKQPYIYKQ